MNRNILWTAKCRLHWNSRDKTQPIRCLVFTFLRLLLLPLQYPFLSILALRDTGPEVKNQQPTIFSWLLRTGVYEIESIFILWDKAVNHLQFSIMRITHCNPALKSTWPESLNSVELYVCHHVKWNQGLAIWTLLFWNPNLYLDCTNRQMCLCMCFVFKMNFPTVSWSTVVFIPMVLSAEECRINFICKQLTVKQVIFFFFLYL